MSDINALFGKDYIHQLTDDIIIKIKPFKVSDMGKLKGLENDAEGTKSIELINDILLYNFPNSTPEQRSEVGMEYLQSIMLGIFKANKIKVPEELKE